MCFQYFESVVLIREIRGVVVWFAALPFTSALYIAHCVNVVLFTLALDHCQLCDQISFRTRTCVYLHNTTELHVLVLCFGKKVAWTSYIFNDDYIMLVVLFKQDDHFSCIP